jgi:prophage tail gpP-like protein
MTTRNRDTVRAEAVGVGTLDRFTSFSIASDLGGPSEANFEIGDDGTWGALESYVKPGTLYRVFVNNALRLTGRVEVDTIPIDLQGSVVQFTVRTKLADAWYASADPRTKTNGVTIKQFILALFAPLGYVESDFIFDADVSRNLMTGTSRTSPKPAADLEPLKEEQAKVNPPETIFQAADRHLRRHGMMLWDAPNGKIVIGAPDDGQQPLYYFRSMFGSAGRANNLLSATYVNDISEAATVLGVYGAGGKAGFQQTKVRGVVEDADLIAAGFYRPVLIIAEGLKTKALAQRAANREATNRNKKRGGWDLKLDGLSWWDGNSSIAFGIDTVCDVRTSAAGGPSGAYLVTRVESTRDPNQGDMTRLVVLKKGLWVL